MSNPETFESASPSQEHADRPFDFNFYRQIFSERKKRILLTVGAVFVLSSLIAFRMPDVYESQVQILVEKPGKTQEVFQQAAGPSFSGEDDYYGTQINILTGRKIADQVEEELGLLPESFKIKAKRIPMSRVLSLTVRYKEPELTAKIANRLTSYYVDEKNQQDLFLPRQVLGMLPSEAEIDAEASDPDEEAVPGKSKKELPITFLNKISSDPLILKLESQRLDVETQVREYSQRYKWKHPVMLSLSEKLSFIKSQIKFRKKKILTDLRINLAGEFTVSNIKILSKAETPVSPVGPNRFLIIFLSTLAAFVVSLYTAILAENANEKIRHEDDLRETDDLIYLGSVPLIREIRQNKKPGNKKDAPAGTPSICEIFRNDPILMDALAKVRTHILFSNSYEKVKFMMITSGVPGEGKSTVSALLSMSFDMMGKKVLLIDADMRRPSMHTHLGLPNEKGLRDLLEGTAKLEDVLLSVPGTNMKFLPAGHPTSNPTELIVKDQFPLLLEEFSKNFDRIFLDVPPVLFIPDAFILAKYVHSTVFVCRAGLAEKKALRAMIDQYESLKPLHSVAGAIINGLDFDKYKNRYKYLKHYKSYYQVKTFPPLPSKG